MLLFLRRIMNALPKHVHAIKFSTQGKEITTGVSVPFKYPEVRRDETVKDNYHGTEIVDPYRWLEDPSSDETKLFIEAQNSVSLAYINSCPDKQKISSCITDLWNFPRVSVPYRFGNKYFQSKNTGLQNQDVIYCKHSLQGDERVFLDPNTLSEDGTVALVSKSFSKDGKTVAYAVSTSGSDWVEIKFRDAESGRDYEEVLKRVKFSPLTWLHNNQAILYGAYLDLAGTADGSEAETVQNQKLYYHKLGTDQSEDFVIVDFTDPEILIGANVSYCGNYVVVTPRKGTKNNLVYYSKLKGNNVAGKLELHPVVTEYEADYDYITNDDNICLFVTNKDAPNYKVILIDLENPAPENWSDLIPEHPKDVLDFCTPINNNNLAVVYLRDVKSVFHIHDLKTGDRVVDIPLDIGTITSISGKREHQEMFYSFCSFLTPTLIYRVDFTKPEIEAELIHETKINKMDTSAFETRQVFYTSKDGTAVPMFIVNKRGLVKNSDNACLLYGYGGFNIKVSPSFSVSRLVFVKNFNGIFALANIRGGGEYGDAWHRGGRFENKQNCFDDFQYAAKYLIENRYTNPKKVVIQGGSNGGLLVAACINQAPHLFGAAICQVGVLDMFRYHNFTIGYAWKSDYGSVANLESFEYISKYSPLHNIRVPKEGQYPATLLLTADHDDRVVPLHSLKFIAELQNSVAKSAGQTNPLMIRVETRAGHGAGKPTTKVIEEVSDIFSFISNSLGIVFHD